MLRKEIKGNVWRQLCAKAIESNGGYSRGYHDRAALSWDVSVSGYIPNYWDTLIEQLTQQHGWTRDEFFEIDPAKLAELKEKWESDEHQSAVWDTAVEDMRYSLKDTDSYRTIRPDIAGRYGLPGSHVKLHSAQLDTLGPVRKWRRTGQWEHIPYFDVKWEFHGRSGKHLCLMEFEGRDLKLRSDDLALFIREDDQGSYTNEWCQKLLAFIHECDIMFSSKAVQDEYLYQVSSQLHLDMYEALMATRRERKEAAERQYWAERDVATEP